MSEEDWPMPSDNDFKIFSTTEKRMVSRRPRATDASWNLARTETKKVFQGVMRSRSSLQVYLAIHFLIVDQRKMMIFAAVSSK
jgi:hypothetical protein